MNRSLRAWRIVPFIAALLLLAACGPRSGVPLVWIDVPVDGLNLPEGAPVNIEGHASHASGVDRVELLANGTLVATLTGLDGSGSLYTFRGSWTPGGPGEHVLQAIAYAPDGAASDADTARIVVGLPTFAGPDLSIVRVEAVVEGSGDLTPACNTRVVYRNSGTEDGRLRV